MFLNSQPKRIGEYFGVCDVCGQGKLVTYCSLCNASLCATCRTDWAGRGIAALKRFLTGRRVGGRAI